MGRRDLIQVRRGTAAAWATENPVLADGELGFEEPATPGGQGKFKIGDGVTAWNALLYIGGSGGSAITAKDEGTTLTSALASLNFTGAGVMATAVGDDVQVDVPGGALTWHTVHNYDGTTTTGLTAIGGSWSSDGTVIQQTNPSGGFYFLRTPRSALRIPFFVEAEIRIPSPSASNYVGFFILNASDSAAWVHVRYRYNGSWFVDVTDSGGGSSITYALSDMAANTWGKLGIQMQGIGVSVWHNDALLGSSLHAVNAGQAASASLATSTAAADFRNFRVLDLNLPAP